MTSITPPPETLFPISECTVEDIPQMQEVWAAAFADNSLNRSMFPSTLNPDEVTAWYHKRAAGQLARPEVHVFKVTDPTTNKIAAFMRWGYPHTKPTPSPEEASQTPPPKKRESDAAWPPGTNVALCDAKFGTLDGWREIYVDDEETYVAQLLCTRPLYQRKGLGMRLLKHVLDCADREGRKAYIEATPEGYGLYAKMGFRDLDVKDIDLTAWGEGVTRTVAMMREPVGKV